MNPQLHVTHAIASEARGLFHSNSIGRKARYAGDLALHLVHDYLTIYDGRGDYDSGEDPGEGV